MAIFNVAQDLGVDDFELTVGRFWASGDSGTNWHNGSDRVFKCGYPERRDLTFIPRKSGGWQSQTKPPILSTSHLSGKSTCYTMNTPEQCSIE